MYWPVAPSRVIHHHSPADIIALARNRKGTLFASVSKFEIIVWNGRPTARLASVQRLPGSISKYGENGSVSWSHDGRSLLLLTSHGYIINYVVRSTGSAVLHYPPTAEFPPGAGEGEDIGGLILENAGVSRVDKRCTSISSHSRHVLLSTSDPPTILRVPWPIPAELSNKSISPNDSDPQVVPPIDGDEEDQVDVQKWILKDLPWLEGLEDDVVVTHFNYPRTLGQHTLIFSDGRAFIVQFRQSSVISARESTTYLRQSLISPGSDENPYDSVTPISRSPTTTIVGRQVYPIGADSGNRDGATTIAVNPKFGLAAVGTSVGTIHAISLPIFPQPPRPSHKYHLATTIGRQADTGAVKDLSWTSDGYCLAVAYERGWAVWSIGGRLCGYGVKEGADRSSGKVQHDSYMRGASNVFWLPGNLELVMLANADDQGSERIHVLPFTKSSNTSQQTPDSAQYALLQLDDKLLVYRGADQPDMSVINPDSDGWQSVKYPMMYISTNWPIRYATISIDGTLIAIAGRYGLTHFSSISGRWKLFRDEAEENEITVHGGLLWYHHVLVAAVETDHGNEIRMYSRDLDLANKNVLHTETLPAPILLMSLLENSLLVYTADNTLYHFLIEATKDSIRLNVCGSISFRGIVAMPNRVRGMSWMIPSTQKALGEPIHDLMVATIIFLVDSRLVLLRPRRAGNNEVRYDMQVLADHIESYWTHLSGISTLENSLWGYDGSSIRVWMDALTVEATTVNSETDSYLTVRESVKLDLDFYPLSILMDKAVIIGVEHEVSGRQGLPFTLFKFHSGAHLFLPAVLRYHLDAQRIKSAVSLASCYDQLVYFEHALEVLLYRVLDDVPPPVFDGNVGVRADALLRCTIEFLDFFPQSLNIIVACARKTETTKWRDLFSMAGEPRDLYKKCIKRNLLATASSYLLVMHTMQPDASGSEDTIHLLQLAIKQQDTQLAKELLRFLQGIDATGESLRTALEEIGLC